MSRAALASLGAAAALTFAALAGPRAGAAQATVDLPVVLPSALVDLRTTEGAALVGAQWRYSDARIVEVDHRAPGPDLRPSGPPNRTNDSI